MWSKKKILKCLSCGNPYEYCHGRIVTPYFRHEAKDICNGLYSEPETEEHLLGKIDLYEWLKKQEDVTDVILEGWLEDTKQRPDIMFKYKGDQCVIEYQCTPISSEYFERHDLYKNAGIKDIWICGVKNYIDQYHNGKGHKRISVLEEENGQLYYNPFTKQIYDVEKEMSQLIFNKIIKKKLYILMESPEDYVNCKFKKYLLIKSEAKSSHAEYEYPSGKRSNKYRYPIATRYFDENRSLARCYDLSKIKLTEVE